MTTNAVTADSALGSPRPTPSVSLRQHGRAVALASLGHAVRALELTLVPEGGPVRVVGARVTRRTRGFLVDYHQAGPTAPVKGLVVSLTGDTILPGRGTVARLRVAGGATRGGQLRLKEVRVAE
jgi:hypothetical protein